MSAGSGTPHDDLALLRGVIDKLEGTERLLDGRNFRPHATRKRREALARVAAELERLLLENIRLRGVTPRANLVDQLMEAERELERLRDGLRRIADKQTETLETLRTHGIVFDNLDDRWQKVAFTIYTDLCEIDTWAHELLDEDVSGRALLSASQDREETA